jgi:AraC-like DNA-binding protein
MDVLISTDDVPPAGRYNAWLSAICDTVGLLDVRIDKGVPVHGEIRTGRLGPVGVGTVVTTTPHSVHRTPGLIRRDSTEVYRVALVVAGCPVLRQRDREARLRQGEFAVYDCTEPYVFAHSSSCQLALFNIPHQLLALPRDLVTRLLAVPIAADHGVGALVSPLLHRLSRDSGCYSPASAARLSTVMTDVISTALADHASRGEVVPRESRDQSLLIRVIAYIERHLGEPDLAPGTVAAANFISLRHLHRMFEGENTTVSAWIRRRRLERCRDDLADPVNAALPVSAVAARWGLTDPAHFSRVFRRAYEVPPNEYRRMCLGRLASLLGQSCRVRRTASHSCTDATDSSGTAAATRIASRPASASTASSVSAPGPHRKFRRRPAWSTVATSCDPVSMWSQRDRSR